MAAIDRRQFLVSAVAGAFVLGWGVPRRVAAQAGGGGRAVGVWVVIDPDDTTTIRIARSEMGQGTSTGLAQLVAEEFDADWSKVRTEFVAPEVNLANKRAWGDMSTGGSRGLRGSSTTCARAGRPHEPC